ncbi:MAG: hypothetical protein H7Y27_13640 [Gemmatimonadaceae bacterium]|nr:hypothetical protein [Chitinophagaceae bacterium]
MEPKTMLIIGAILVILLAIIFKDRVKAAFGGLTIDSDGRTNKNTAKVEGEQNIVKQGTRTAANTELPTVNKTNIEGKGNDIEQG